MKYSIVMTTYNGEKYLKEQLDSILNQTYSDFELIVQDDGSSDKTDEIMFDYQKKDNRIHFFKNEKNLGYAKNFLNTLEKTNGEYIFFADQDDIWKENKINDFDAVLSDNKKIDLLISQFKNFPIEDKNTFMYRNGFVEKLDFDTILLHCSFPGMTMCLSSRIKDKLSNFLNSDVIAHDWLISLLAGNSGTAFYMNRIETLHRIHESNASQLDNKHGILAERLSFVDVLIRHYRYAANLDFYTEKNKTKVFCFLYIVEKRKKILINRNFFKQVIWLFSILPVAISVHYPLRALLNDICISYQGNKK